MVKKTYLLYKKLVNSINLNELTLNIKDSIVIILLI